MQSFTLIGLLENDQVNLIARIEIWADPICRKDSLLTFKKLSNLNLYPLTLELNFIMNKKMHLWTANGRWSK